MKIVLDLTKIVAEGKLSEAQALELQALAKPQTSLLAINILMAFGLVAIAAGIMALLPTVATAIALGVLMVGIGLGITFGAGVQWSLVGTAVTIAGALIAAAGIVGQAQAHWFGFAIAAALLMGLAIATRSGLMSALTVFALAAMLGSDTGYEFASYFLAINEPTFTIVVFAVLALAAYLITRHIPADYEPVALSFARISLVMVNFGFWIGSLWGDDPGHSWRPQTLIHIPDYVFVIGWALALIGVGGWAARVNRRFVVNTAATFGAIHFYTQWFERLGAEPLTIALAGVLVVAVAFGLWRYNLTPRRVGAEI